MGPFTRNRWKPPAPPHCSCPEHFEQLRDLELPTLFDDIESMTAGELLAAQALGVEPLPAKKNDFHWALWVGDEARGCYDDDSELQLDASIGLRPGVERVEWRDREEFLVDAPTLCRDGVLAAVVRALEDPRVRR
ncbi:MAG TPA: hypothetical protein VF062_03935 [Candidatus Limnocylindrales bacterium]